MTGVQILRCSGKQWTKSSGSSSTDMRCGKVGCKPRCFSWCVSREHMACYHFFEFMRRLLSTLVLFVIGFGVFAPTALNAAGVSTQACCRRNGKHHCISSAAEVSGDTSASFGATSADCPHHAHSSLVTGAARLESNPSFVLHLPTANLLSIRNVLYPGSPDEARHSERGPPAFALHLILSS
jgi:hypothetical protein